jgi:hypothetical protein
VALRLLRTIPWVVRLGRRDPERLLSLLIRAHEIEEVEADMIAAFRRGYEEGLKKGTAQWLEQQ